MQRPHNNVSRFSLVISKIKTVNHPRAYGTTRMHACMPIWSIESFFRPLLQDNSCCTMSMIHVLLLLLLFAPFAFLLLLDRLHVTLVETTDTVPNGSKGEPFKDVTLFRCQIQQTLCQMVVVELLGLGVVER